jgi:hypothetical protein
MHAYTCRQEQEEAFLCPAIRFKQENETDSCPSNQGGKKTQTGQRLTAFPLTFTHTHNHPHTTTQRESGEGSYDLGFPSFRIRNNNYTLTWVENFILIL